MCLIRQLRHISLYISLCIFPLLIGPVPLLEAKTSPHIHAKPTSIQEALISISQVEPNSGMKGVDCIYVINLERRPERWQYMQNLCKKYGFLPSRVNAVDGTKLSEKTIKSLFGKYPIRLKRGQIGCFLSHVSIFLDSYTRHFQCVWICEDDIEIKQNPLQLPLLLDMLTALDPDWDILYTDPECTNTPAYCINKPLGSPNPNVSSDFRPDQHHPPLRYFLSKRIINNYFTRIGQRYGTYSYFISQKGIKKLVDYFLHVYLWTPIDVDMHYVPNIRQYVLNKPIVSTCLYAGTDTLDNTSSPSTKTQN